VVDKGYTVREAAEAMNVGHSSMDRWVAQLRRERNCMTPTGTAMTADVGQIVGKRYLSCRFRVEKFLLGDNYQVSDIIYKLRIRHAQAAHCSIHADWINFQCNVTRGHWKLVNY